MATLTLNTDDGDPPTVLGDDCVLVFLDDTGHETFADDNFPVFGLGGCAVPLAQYETAISNPWREIKERHFGGRDSALHASDLHNPTKIQLETLSAFFRSPQFSRFAAVASRETVVPTNMHPYHLVALSLMRRIALIVPRFSCSEVALLLESSERANNLAEQYLGGFRTLPDTSHPRPGEIPIQHFFMPKSLNEPGLEVADFVMQASGRHIRNALSKGATYGKDFQAIFHAVPKDVVEFIHITEARVGEA